MIDLNPNFVIGWVSDPPRVADLIAERQQRGDAVLSSAFAATQANDLPGTWERLKARGICGVFLRDRELQILKSYRRPYLQKCGTCVSRGMARGVQTSLDVAIADNIELRKPVEITFAPIYSMARHEFGHDRCGRGDGAILADAAKAVHDAGVATTDLFKGMSEDDVEKLAVRYAAPGVGTPLEWQKAAKGHTCITFWPETLSALFDCLAAGYAVPYAHSYVTGNPNANGISDLGSMGPHCRCFTGVFLDQNGETQLESCESWGRFPAGQPTNQDQTMPVIQIPRITLKYAGGEKSLAPGCVGVMATRFWDQIQQGGEAWAVGAPQFIPESISSLIN